MQKANITIGIPVYNEEQYISKTIMSVLENEPSRIIISDNISNDRTGDIVREFAKQYSTIEYVKLKKEISAADNFYNTIKLCQSEYFMWIGGHDLIPLNYLDELLKAHTQESILSFSPANNIDPNGNITSQYEYIYHKALEDDDPFVRVYALIANLANCSLIHGLFKSEVLKECMKDLPRCLANDHVLLCRAAALGKFAYTKSTIFGRRQARIEPVDQLISRQARHLGTDVLNKRESALHQFRCICGIKSSDPKRKILWCEQAKKVLENRFGKFMN